ncbi:NADH dehydrogenase subunit 5 [Bacillus timonensis]|uniref:Probable inorganic carbon transporter subunit DabB n=1 Tax=Bacillus timonensis TaxID=1033734 RepID=A0A4S3PTQ4_9BACI|nr:NADH dehydrogenase subunit 5 [Bacillus timonensis]THE13130.1 NADH dehydrogenase subunit 5 [Bacillus timonensis]
MHSLNLFTVQSGFFILLTLSLLSAFIFLHPKVPLNYVRTHITIIALPPIMAITVLLFESGSVIIGPWHMDSLSWLLAAFVLTVGLIVQRFSVRYLLGDRSYRKYFALLTLTTVANSLAWCNDDLRLLLILWGVTLLGLTLLIGLRKEWQVAKNAARRSAQQFAISWLILVVASVWVANITGHWQLSLALDEVSIDQLDAWEKFCINLLLIIAVVIPAAQWPFQRWLIDSVVAPTPISAVMHAGIVNGGGMILSRFSPLFNGDPAQIVLIILASFSVLIGTGMMLVQVDYKRQLVGSTIAQMAFMLIQCALGAYWAAIIHAVLHGLFKATLFLQAGSAVDQNRFVSRTNQQPSILWSVTGGGLGLFVGACFLLTSQGGAYQFLSAVIIGWSVFYAWKQLVGSGYGRIGRVVGFSLILVIGIVFVLIHSALVHLLDEMIQTGGELPMFVAILLLFLLLAGSVLGTWAVRHRSSKVYAFIYLWLVKWSEPRRESIDSHPKYLTKLHVKGRMHDEYHIS